MQTHGLNVLLPLSLLLTSLACEAMSPSARPCTPTHAAGTWAGVSRTGHVAVLLELRPDGQGRFEVWARERDGEPSHLTRQIEQWTADDGGLHFRNDSAPQTRSVTVLKATATCIEGQPRDMAATFWIQDIAYAELSLTPLASFVAQHQHLQTFYQSIGERAPAARPLRDTQ